TVKETKTICKEVRLRKIEYERKRREKIKKDPTGQKQQRQKERLKYLMKKEKKQVKPEEQARNESRPPSAGKKSKKINSEVFPAVLDFSISESLQQQKSLFEGPTYDCPDCGRTYKLKSSLRNHRKWECGKEPQFKCPYCAYKAKQKMHLVRHLDRVHKEIDYGVLSEMELTLEVNEDKE
ncbi:hypothetical protein ILUMI_13427, partial [Ignelater luminosus]